MTLADRVRSLGKPKILVLGDLVLDRYVFGNMERISPEAPIGVLRAHEEECRLGCAGSAARNLAVLGAEVVLCGFIGEDEAGDEVLRLAADVGMDTGGVIRVSGRATTKKSRFLARRTAGGQQVLRVDWEAREPYSVDAVADLGAAVLDRVADADLVVLSDYAKGALTKELARAVIAAARVKGLRVIVDPKPPAHDRYRGASAATPNRPEASTWVGFPVIDAESAERAALKILRDLDLEAAVVKLDRDGIFLAERDGTTAHFPVEPRELFDVTGAGDMVIAALAMGVAAGAGYADSVRLANIAAGIEVSRLGVVSVSREEILETLHEDRPAGATVPSVEELLEVLAARRQRGEKIVFTNGCFDIVHAGHVRLLRAARAEGDALVVGLNSDASVRRLKGEGRPVTPQAERAEMLLSLSCVDHVVIFDEDTPLEVVSRVLPDVLVKGEDWRDKGVVGREVVEANGGKVVLVALAPGLSTTNILRRIREEEA